MLELLVLECLMLELLVFEFLVLELPSMVGRSVHHRRWIAMTSVNCDVTQKSP